MKRLVVLGWLLIFSFGCSPAIGCNSLFSTGPCTRILFIGNSYTYVNDLPTMFAELAGAGGHPIETGMSAQGGWTLTDHVKSADTIDKIKSSRWNYVVLQEQSEIPSVPDWRTQNMYPAARILVQDIRDSGAAPIFFVTWAHSSGLPTAGLQNYEAMQFQIDNGYLGIAQELNVPESPVGFAWLEEWRKDPQLNLWQVDGSHPNELGTYLAACVFYSVIFRQSPEGLSFTAGLPAETAKLLQNIAADTVLTNPQQWFLP
jgi:hypothetical protein